MKTVEILISGRVQRVGFRACIKKTAMNMGILGEAMNLPDGRVRILASADPVMLEKFTSMLYGCPRVIIRDMRILTHPPIEFDDFSILRGESQYIT